MDQGVIVGDLESSTVINTVKNESLPPEDGDKKKEASRIRKKFELLYFNLDFVYLTNMNYFSCYFVDFEFNMLKMPKIKNPEEEPDKILNFFMIKKKSVGPKDIKLIEELILSLNDENQFLYEDDYYSTNRLIKSRSSSNRSDHNSQAIFLQQINEYKKKDPKIMRQKQCHQIRVLVLVFIFILQGNANELQSKRSGIDRRVDD